jgi:DNA repair protein SbcC/Rad50
MRPLRLELAAFGPFSGMEVIDFRVLGEHRLFLVHGATGAGKTTLLDAISFALYGDASGGTRDGKGLRSQFAGPEQPTRVVLDFELGERRFRVTRQPEQERAKRRGEGTTVSPPSATLWERSGLEPEEAEEGRVLATRSGQVSEKVAEILGFRSEQFRQVIVLPQGRFIELLLAKSREREDILQQLFDTAFYGEVEEALKQRSRDLRQEAEMLRAQRGALLEQEKCADEAALEARLDELQAQRGEAAARLMRLEQAHTDASRALERVSARQALFDKAERARAELVSLRAREDEMSAQGARLKAARKAQGLDDLGAAVTERREARAHAARALATAEQRHAVTEEVLARARERLRAERARAPEREARAKRLAELERAVPLFEELAARQERCDAARAEHERATRRLQERARGLEQARGHLDALRLAREAGSAVLLADTLEAGVPCPVCGSTEHPRPAAGSRDVPSTEAMAQAEAAVATVQQALDAARESQQRADREQAGLDAGVKALETQLDDLAGRAELDPNTATETLARLRAERQAAETSLEAAQAEDQRAGEAAAAAMAALEAARARQADAQDAAAAIEKQWRQRLAEAGFGDDEAYRAAQLAPAEAERLEVELEHYRQALASAKGRAAETQAEIEGMKPPDFVGATEVASAAAEAYRAAADTHGGLSQRVVTLAQLQERLAGLAAEFERVEALYQVHGSIASVAAGENPHRISLQRFVLASRLDDVLAAASHRLALMSRGRYRIRRNIEPADRRSAGGLELEVEDGYTGGTRPVSTLSGGESFQAALSLALGLSEVVQAHAGGIRLDTLFIDEGFGTLDPEALDLAIDTLLDLQQSGRMVGVISHVPELRERIDVRLEVRPGTAGSRAAFHLP